MQPKFVHYVRGCPKTYSSSSIAHMPNTQLRRTSTAVMTWFMTATTPSSFAHFPMVYGLAGMRIGWAHAHPDILRNLVRVQRPGNLSSPGLAAAEAALGEPALIGARIERNAQTRSTFTQALTALGLGVLPSQANYVLVTLPIESPTSADALRDALELEGILVHGMAPYGLPESLRISLGSPADMAEVAQVIARILQGRNSA